MPLFQQIAPAKVNLTLRVLGRRPDGYHELESLVAFADVADRLTLDTSRPPGVEVAGRFADAIAGSNILHATLDRLAATAPQLRLGHCSLDKHLPVAAGLGGGSADAAALIRAVQAANPAQATALDWPAIALALGADVPVCLAGRSAWMRGIGQRLDAVQLPALHVVLATPEDLVPADKTRRVFRALAAPPLPAPPTTADPEADVPAAIATNADLVALIRRTGNDLTAAAAGIVPGITEAIADLTALDGCEIACLSGAGPTSFGVFPNEAAALSAAARLQARHPRWWITAAVLDRYESAAHPAP